VTCVRGAPKQTVHLCLCVLFANSSCNAFCEIFRPTVTQVFRWKTLQPLEFQSLFAICKYKDKTVHCSRVAGTPASYRRPPPYVRHVSWPKLAKRTVVSRTLISEGCNVTNWGFVPGYSIHATEVPNDNKNKLK